MQTDHIFYALFQTAPEILVSLVSTQTDQAYKFRSVEVKQTAFRLDGVLTPAVENANNPTILVEVQFQKDKAFYRRLFAEIFLFLRHNSKINYWQAIVIFEKRSREPVDKLAFQVLLSSPQVHRIYLEDFESISPDSIGSAIFQLIVSEPTLAIGRAKAILARVEVQSSESELSKSQILGLIETIVVYKFPNLEREVLAAMLGVVEMRQTRVFQDALKEGREEGREEGQKEGCSKTIIKLLSLKLGELSKKSVSHIEALSGEQLDSLSDRYLEIRSVDDLEKCLEGLPTEGDLAGKSASGLPDQPETVNITDLSVNR